MASLSEDNKTAIKIDHRPSPPLFSQDPSAKLGLSQNPEQRSNSAGPTTSSSTTVEPSKSSISNDVTDGWEDVQELVAAEDEEKRYKSMRAEDIAEPSIIHPPPLPVVSAQPVLDTPPVTVQPASRASNELLEDVSHTMVGTSRPMLPSSVPSGDKTLLRPKAVDRRPYRPKPVTSYREIFNISDGENFCYDQSVLLQPFNRVVYMTQTSMNGEDFHRYAWLLAQSEENWYAMPSAATLARMRTSGLEKRKPIANPRPTGASIPIIVANDSLYLESDGEEHVEKEGWGDCTLLHPDDPLKINEENCEGSDVRSTSEDGATIYETRHGVDDTNEKRNRKVWRCEKCYRKNLQLHEDIGWVYFTVIRADTQGSGEEQRGNGVGMFMFRKSSTREQAASRAFYDAGALGYSTVFCCAVRADVQLLGWRGKVKVVINCVHRVLAPEAEGVLRVYL